MDLSMRVFYQNWELNKNVISDGKSAKQLILILAYYTLEKEIHKGKFQIQYKKNDSARFIFTINAWP